MSVQTVRAPLKTSDTSLRASASSALALPPQALSVAIRATEDRAARAVRAGPSRRTVRVMVSVRIRGQRLTQSRERIFGDLHERTLGLLAVAGVEADDRYVGGQGQRGGDLLGGVARDTVELVDGDDEGDALGLEVVQRRERLVEARHVDQHDGADGAAAQVVPHEPEATLPGRAEEVEHEVLGQGQAAEV